VNTIPASVSGFTVKNINTFALKIPIPANSTYVSSTLTGGSGLGSTAPKITLASGVRDAELPGPMAGGAAFQLPTITVNLKAGELGHDPDQARRHQLHQPGPDLQHRGQCVLRHHRADACYPNPSPVFTTTTIG